MANGRKWFQGGFPFLNQNDKQMNILWIHWKSRICVLGLGVWWQRSLMSSFLVLNLFSLQHRGSQHLSFNRVQIFDMWFCLCLIIELIKWVASIKGMKGEQAIQLVFDCLYSWTCCKLHSLYAFNDLVRYLRWGKGTKLAAVCTYIHCNCFMQCIGRLLCEVGFMQ